MWICSRCQAENNDAYTQCAQCAAPRSHRRFAGRPTVTPTLQAQPPERRMQGAENAPAPGRPPYAPETPAKTPYAAEAASRATKAADNLGEPYTAADPPARPLRAADGSVRLSNSAVEPRAAHRRAPGGFVRLAGATLAILLPALVVFLAVLNQAYLRPQIAGWFAPVGEVILSPAGAPLPPAPSFLRTPAFGWAAYGLLTFLAALLAAAPGLALWAQGRLLKAMRGR